MKNTLSITSDCVCTCVDSIADGTNRIFVALNVGNTNKPQFKIWLNDGLKQTINLIKNQLNMVIISDELFVPNGIIKFQYLDAEYTGKFFTISFPEKLEGNLAVKMKREYVYIAKYTAKTVAGSNVEWTQLQTEGDKIAEITIDGEKTEVYAPNGGGTKEIYIGTDEPTDSNIILWIDTASSPSPTPTPGSNAKLKKVATMNSTSGVTILEPDIVKDNGTTAEVGKIAVVELATYKYLFMIVQKTDTQLILNVNGNGFIAKTAPYYNPYIYDNNTLMDVLNKETESIDITLRSATTNIYAITREEFEKSLIKVAEIRNSNDVTMLDENIVSLSSTWVDGANFNVLETEKYNFMVTHASGEYIRDMFLDVNANGKVYTSMATYSPVFSNYKYADFIYDQALNIKIGNFSGHHILDADIYAIDKSVMEFY